MFLTLSIHTQCESVCSKPQTLSLLFILVTFSTIVVQLVLNVAIELDHANRPYSATIAVFGSIIPVSLAWTKEHTVWPP